MTNAIYAETKATMEEVQRLPEEAQRAILTMLRGAIVISDMYGAANLSRSGERREGA